VPPLVSFLLPLRDNETADWRREVLSCAIMAWIGFSEREQEAGLDMQAAGSEGAATTLERGFGDVKVCRRTLSGKTSDKLFSSCDESARVPSERSPLGEDPLDSALASRCMEEEEEAGGVGYGMEGSSCEAGT